MRPLEGKVALVTGASAPNGIGRAIALRLAQDGAAVVVSDIDGQMEVGGKTVSRLELLQNTVAEIVSSDGIAISLILDVTDAESIEAGIKQSLAEFGRLDILVNNAGSLAGSNSFLSTTEFGPDGILCNTVCPGYIATDMHTAANNRLAKERDISVVEIKKERYANVALRDAGLPVDVANAVAYLAGPQANYVTGMNLPVTGGVPFGI